MRKSSRHRRRLFAECRDTYERIVIQARHFRRGISVPFARVGGERWKGL